MGKKNKNKENLMEEEVIMDEGNSPEKEVNTDPLVVANNELQAEKDRYLRLFAEFENYKKRTTRERIELFKTASQDLMVSILPVLDDFDRALKEIEKSKDKNLLLGVELINNKLNEILRVKGLDTVATSQGDIFDAELHEAVTQIPAPSEDMKGKIIEVLEKGYMLGEKVIRYPKVVIGQ